jgi:hypothetical protein
LEPDDFRPEVQPLIEEILFGDSEKCLAGQYGVENINVTSSDGQQLNFTLKHSFCGQLDKMQVWSKREDDDDALCYEFDNEKCEKVIGEYTARCSNGWAMINIIAEKGEQFSQNVDVPTPQCQEDMEFVDFNPQKRCYWQIKVPCPFNTLDRRLVEQEMPVKPVELTTKLKKIESDCESKSREVDIVPISVDKCDVSDFEPPLKLISQDKDTVTFSVSQVWKGCSSEANESLSWIAVDYIGLDNNLQCSTYDSVPCGLTTTLTAKCDEGASVIDLYTYDGESDIFSQTDGSSMVVPTACGTRGDNTKMCHFRYILKCEPSQCTKKRPAIRRLGAPVRRFFGKKE